MRGGAAGSISAKEIALNGNNSIERVEGKSVSETERAIGKLNRHKQREQVEYTQCLLRGAGAECLRRTAGALELWS